MKQAIIRLIVLAIVMLNQALIVMGWNPLPFSEEQIFEAVSSAGMVVMAVYTWYRNNNVTKEANEAQKVLDELKGKRR